MNDEIEHKETLQENADMLKGTITGTEKRYPQAVMVKKGLIMLAVLLGLLIGALIITNIYKATHPTDKSAAQETVKVTAIRGGERPNWDKDLYVRKLTPNVSQREIRQGQIDPASPQGQRANNNAVGTNLTVTAATTKVADEEMKKILSAPISSNQINFEIGTNTSATSSNAQPLQQGSRGEEPLNKDDQNLQSEKKTFLKLSTYASDDYLHEGLKNPVSPFEVKAGTIIPAILITGINSDLPGQITAQVRSSVYDTVSGKHLLIPQGAKITGLYDSQIAYGQERVLVVWKRIIFPNGQSIDLEGMPGVDMSGYAGFNDQVNNHYGKIFGSVILMSVISSGAQLSQPQNNNNNVNSNPTVNQQLAASLGTNIMNAANNLLQKNINIQPTLVIRPGYLMNISVTKDIVFPKGYEERTTYDD